MYINHELKKGTRLIIMKMTLGLSPPRDLYSIPDWKFINLFLLILVKGAIYINDGKVNQQKVIIIRMPLSLEELAAVVVVVGSPAASDRSEAAIVIYNGHKSRAPSVGHGS